MSGNIQEDVKQLLDRCLVIIFKEKKHRKSNETAQDFLDVNKDLDNIIRGESDNNCPVQNGNDKGATTEDIIPENIQSKHRNGKDLYEEFVSQNKGCFWDPHLEESLNNLQVVGYIYPHTLLLGGRDIYLDTVRGAWSRRVLQAPPAFVIHKIGEIENVGMKITPQAQFTPLPEALCMIISDLNKLNSIATFEEIMKQLKRKYKGVHQPAEEIVYEALGTLLKERKVYHTGRGYHIITPELFAHLNHLNGCATLQDHRNSIFIPLPHNQMTEMCSIACQTDDLLNQVAAQEKNDKEEKSSKVKKFERSNSLRESKKSSKDKKLNSDVLTRSASMRLNDEKAKSLVKDINLKSSEIHQDKDKGEKTSLFSKIFGGKSKKKQQALYITEDAMLDEEENVVEKSAVEYATFSGQFPPPDIQWYETQTKAAMLFQETSPRGNPLSKSGTFHCLRKPYMVDAEAQSDIFDDADFEKMCPVHKSKTLPENISGFVEGLQSHTRQRSSSSHSQDSKHSHSEFPKDARHFTKSKHMSRSKKHRKHREKRRSKLINDTLTPPKENNLDNVPYVDHTSSDNYGRTITSAVKPKTVKLSTNFTHNSEAIYEDIGEYQKDTIENQNEGDIDPESARVNHHSPSSGNSITNDGNTASSVNQVKNSSHKNKIYRKYKEMYNHCTTACNNDISFEYNGKLPDKTISLSKSRDSGVNCIGLQELQPCITVPLSEISNSLNYSGEADQPYIVEQTQKYNVTESKVNFIHNDTKSFRSRSHSTDAMNRNRGNVVVHQAEVYSSVDYHKNNHSNIHEDSGFNSPKANFSLHSPHYNSFNQHRGQEKHMLHSSRYHNNFNHEKTCQGQTKDLPSLNNSFINNVNCVPHEALNDSAGYLETDLDHPSLDRSRSVREGSPSQIEEVENLPRGFQLLQPENLKSLSLNNELKKHQETSPLNGLDKYQRHNAHMKDFHDQSNSLNNSSRTRHTNNPNRKSANSDRYLVNSRFQQNKAKSSDFEVVGVI